MFKEFRQSIFMYLRRSLEGEILFVSENIVFNINK